MIPRELQSPLVLRQFIPVYQMQALKKFVTAAYEKLDVGISMGAITDPEIVGAMHWGGLAVPQLKALFPGWNEIMAPMLAEHITKRWPGAEIIDDVSVFRRILPDKSTYIYWHLDADGTGSAPYDPLWNCWLPLEDVGYDYPALEIIAESEAKMRTTPLRPGAGAYRPDKEVAELFPDAKPICPHLKIGDALIFSHYLLHRTQPMKTLKGPRIGAEIRFRIPQEPPPENKIENIRLDIPPPVIPPVNRWRNLFRRNKIGSDL